MRITFRTLPRVVALCVLTLPTLWGQTDWPTYGHDLASTRFSPLAQINATNVSKLVPAWTYHLNANEEGQPARKMKLEATPVVINGVMYVPTPGGHVVALDPETGKELWRYTLPGTDSPSARGVSYWSGDRQSPPEILLGSTDGKLIALNANTGKPVSTFGDKGIVNMKVGVDNGFPDAELGLTSPPLVYKNLVITGARTQEVPYLGMSGDTRAWDVRTGKLVWQFHSVARPGETGGDTWEGDSWKGRSGANVWGFMSIDPELGLLYMPLGSPTEDYWGGNRKGSNLFGNSIVAVEAETGKLRWYFQTVHHDIWDFDNVAAPVLLPVTTNGQTIPAVAQFTKTGYAFILDRRNGKPIFGVEEREVPTSTVPGEKSWPTQPIPLKPPPIARTSFTLNDIATVTPEHEKFCRDKYFSQESYQYGGPFNPFEYNKPTLVFPGNDGGVNWSGASYDPSLGYLFVNPIEKGGIGKIVKSPEGSELDYEKVGPLGRPHENFINPENQWPCQQPPWSSLIAVNANTGEIAWKVPLGIVEELEAIGVHNTGAAFSMGGSIATGGGLIFIGATVDNYFRAFESRTGKMLWETKLKTSAHATPMTYQGKSGKQYVVIEAAGGRGRAAADDSIIAYTLP
jgi:quinoprotein glucose dehydrogenase